MDVSHDEEVITQKWHMASVPDAILNAEEPLVIGIDLVVPLQYTSDVRPSRLDEGVNCASSQGELKVRFHVCPS